MRNEKIKFEILQPAEDVKVMGQYRTHLPA